MRRLPIAILLAGAACATTAPLDTTRNPEATATAAAIGAPTASPTAMPSASPTVAASATPSAAHAAGLPAPPEMALADAVPPKSEAGYVACGASHCAVPGNVCCEGIQLGGDGRSHAHCGKAATLDWSGDFSALSTAAFDAFRACSESFTGVPGALKYCDETADCPAKQLCCARDVQMGQRVQQCVPEKDVGGVCPEFEACVDTAACSGKGAACEAGQCRRKDRKVSCGGASCSGDKPMCCLHGSDANCVELGKCAGATPTDAVTSIECMRPADCPAGDVCCGFYRDDGTRSFGGSLCSAKCDPGDWESALLCDHDADCAANAKRKGFEMRLKCAKDDHWHAPGFKSCVEKK